MHPLRIEKGDIPVERFEPPAERRLSGDTRQAVWNAYTGANGRFHAGIWEGAVGCWKVAYSEEEFCHLVDGRVALQSDDGTRFEFAAGDCFVVPAGFRGTWQNLSPARKYYVVFEE